MNTQYGDLTLTTAQIQERLNLVPEHSQAIAALQQAITAFVTSEQVQTLIGNALADYSTTSAMNTAISNAITNALTSYYTKMAVDNLLNGKVSKENGKGLSANDFTNALKAKLDGLPDSSALATQISTAISTALQPYSTTSAMNTAISNAITNALTSYYTKAQVDTIITGITNNILFLNRALGKYDTVTERTLTQATAGKYVNVNGQEVSASGYGISNTMVINAGDILLIPSAQAVPADVSVVARKITRTYDKVITYTYTTDEGTGRYLTATADYDPTLVYSAIYDGEGVFLYWIYNGVHYEQLPTTHEVTESMYEPLMKQSVSAMPSTGYYVYLCPVGMTVVISGLTATVSGGVALVMGLGIFKNIATNFIGAPGQAVIAQSFAQYLGGIQGIIENLKHMGSFKATDIDCENMPKVCGYPLVVEGAGAPSIVPRFVGQRYHDTTNNKCYEAFAVTNSTANWVLLN
jgi:hypothetical protein